MGKKRRKIKKDKWGLSRKEHLIVRLDKRAPKLLDEKNREFAQSLLKQWARKGDLTANQWHWVSRLVKAPAANETPKNAKHFVYAIQCGEFVKIGFSAKPESRAKDLQVGNAQAVEVVRVEPFPSRAEAKAREAELHGRLADYAVRGEWFRKEALAEI